ncbi:MAG: 1-(5-phosphoribosyl)-5-[(5-phosphoribosylamino)methylideneamino]imidazole-4-carboxamide isomerase [Microgenomates group bacterium]
MKIIPAIDIQDGKCVRLMRGDFDKSTTYGTDPYEMALKWRGMGAKIIQVIDLDAARYGKFANQEVVKKIASIPDIKVQYGGGIRSRTDIELLFDWGIWRAIISTSAFENEKEVREWIRNYGEKVLVSLDSKNGKVMKMGWQKDSGISLQKSMEIMKGWGADEFIYTDIVRDGTLQSINEKEVEQLIVTTGLKIVVAGGIRTLEDIVALKKIGASGVIIGRALYEKTLDLKEVLSVC